MTKSLKKESEIATKLQKGKIIKKIIRHKKKELIIEFTDGSRLFIDHKEKGLELSIT